AIAAPLLAVGGYFWLSSGRPPGQISTGFAGRLASGQAGSTAGGGAVAADGSPEVANHMASIPAGDVRMGGWDPGWGKAPATAPRAPAAQTAVNGMMDFGAPGWDPTGRVSRAFDKLAGDVRAKDAAEAERLRKAREGFKRRELDAPGPSS